MENGKLGVATGMGADTGLAQMPAGYAEVNSPDGRRIKSLDEIHASLTNTLERLCMVEKNIDDIQERFVASVMGEHSGEKRVEEKDAESDCTLGLARTVRARAERLIHKTNELNDII